MKISSYGRRVYRFVLALLLSIATLPAFAADPAYRVGRGIADVTGPPVGIQMWGFVRDGQNTEGIHFRLWSRAFVIAEADSDDRIAFVSVDIGSITNSMQRSVVDALQEKFGDTYTLENVILSATHTHSGPGGFWHYGVGSPLGSPFYGQHFDAIVDGIVASIAQAHASLAPADILIDSGEVENGGANRSMPAYLNNPEAERARYDAPTDKTMTQLKFVGADGAIGVVNWFAVHPTSMTYNNKLISGDHKGHASGRFERAQPEGFVAAFAQTNCGDVTANLNLDNTGPGENEFETTRIIAERQLEVALELFDSATEKLSGDIELRHTYVNFSYLPVDERFTSGTGHTTCPSAFGYPMAAGSTEDGGGNPMFKEGMKTRNAMVDNLVKEQFGIDPPTDKCRACQEPKAILFATGETKPYPSQTQVLPLTLVRIGQLALVCVPAEFTTMAGRRIRETVANALGDSIEHVVLVGYANDYTGYVTTREEYETQQYEGGHTLFGPWTLAGYQQEFHRLASAMASGEAVEVGDLPRDVRVGMESETLEAPADTLPAKAAFGDVAANPKKSYKRGAQVEVAFWSGDPRNNFQTGNVYLEVQREDAGGWTTIATDDDWSTKCRWVKDPDAPGQSQFVVAWDIPGDTAPGNYRVVHHGNNGSSTFTGESRPFKVK